LTRESICNGVRCMEQLNVKKINIPKMDGTEQIILEREASLDELQIGSDTLATAFKNQNVTFGMAGVHAAPFVRLKSSGSTNAHDIISESDTFFLKNDAGFTKWCQYMALNQPFEFGNGNAQMSTTNAFRMRAKAGVPSDADLADPEDGCVIVDTTNSDIYVRIGAAWKKVHVA
jgi:hypothetical protein